MTIPETEPDALSAMRAANLHLQATIDGLRQSLEAAAAEADLRATRLQSDEAARIADLTQTIQQMRAQMEAQHDAHDRALQADRAAAQAEIAQLKAGIDALRLTLDGERAASEQVRMTMAAEHALERRTLQQQIQALRDRMEQAMGQTAG